MSHKLFHRTENLFKDILYKNIKDYESFTHLESYFKNRFWNLIIPKTHTDSFDSAEAKKVIFEQKKKDKEVSFYIPEELKVEYKEYLKDLGYAYDYTDVYMYRRVESRYEVNEDNFDTLNEHNVADQMKLADLCFPDDKEHNKLYTELFEYNHKDNFKDKFFYNILRYKGGEAVAFGFLIVDKKEKLSYLHNSGTHPKHRRKGYFTEMVKYRCNLSLDNDINEVFAIVSENNEGYYGLKKMGFEEKDKFYVYSKAE